MRNANAALAGPETRKSLVRVWLALSATWVAFWLVLAATLFAPPATRDPFIDQLRTFSLIMLSPPLVLLAVGAGARFILENFRVSRR